jgi:hypothetical protein
VFFIIFTLFTVQISAQTSINGIVVDKEANRIEFANVAVLSIPDSTYIKGTITDENGYFSLEDIDEKPKILQVSFIGYEPLQIKCTNGNVGELILCKSEYILGEIEIIRAMPTFSLKNNTLITNVEGSLLSSEGTAIDVLRKIPSVKILDGDRIEVFGKGVPLIYIDNRQVRDISEVVQLDSKTIKSIEIVNSPGAKYDASVKSVIVIKTIKQQGDGLGGSFMAYGTKGKKIGNGESINLKYKIKDLDFFSSFNHTLGRRFDKQKNDNSIYGKDQWHISDLFDQSNRNKLTNINIGSNYTNNNNSFGIMYSFIKAGNKVFANGTTSALKNNSKYEEIFQNDFRHKITKRHYTNVYYSGLVNDKLSIDFNFDFLKEGNDTKQIIIENSNNGDRIVTTNANANNHLYASRLSLSYPFVFGTLMLGNEWSFINRSSKYLNEEKVLPNTNSKVKENRIAGFVSYNKKIKKINIETGVRYEYEKFDYFEDNNLKNDQSRRYNNFFPNVLLSYRLDDLSVSLNYVSKITRPSFYMLHNETRYNNRFTLEQGNPLLTPEKTREITLSSSYDYFFFSLNYQYTDNYFTTRFKSYPNDESISLFVYENVKNMKVLNMNFHISPKIKNWNPMLSINMRKQFYELEHKGEIMKMNEPIVFFNFNNSIKLPYSFILSADIDFSTKGNYSNSKLKQTGGLNVGLRNSFFNNSFTANLQITDVFATQRDSYILYGDINYFDKYLKKDTQQFKLTLTYRFNASNNKYSGKSVSRDDVNRL